MPFEQTALQELRHFIPDPLDAQVRVYDVTEGLTESEGLLYASTNDTLKDGVTWDYVVEYMQGERNYEIR